MDDDPRCGASSLFHTIENVERLRMCAFIDLRVSLRMLADELDINKSRIRQMIHEDLSMRKMYAKLVPKLLTSKQKEFRTTISQDTLDWIKKDPVGWIILSPGMNPVSSNIILRWKNKACSGWRRVESALKTRVYWNRESRSCWLLCSILQRGSSWIHSEWPDY